MTRMTFGHKLRYWWFLAAIVPVARWKADRREREYDWTAERQHVRFRAGKRMDILPIRVTTGMILVLAMLALIFGVGISILGVYLHG